MTVAHSTDDQWLKAETKALQKAAGGLEACELVTELGKSQHGNYQNVNSPDFIPANRIRQLEAVTHGSPGWPRVTRALCRLNGGVFVPLPQIDGGSDVLPGQVMALAKELGDVSAKISDGLADDGALSVAEIDAVLAEQDDLDRASAQLRHTLVAKRDARAKAEVSPRSRRHQVSG